MEGTPDDPNDPFDPFDPAAPGGEGEGARGGSITDVAKKAILAGMGALFLTEESARRLARDWKLPKEVIGFIGQQAQGAKDEILRVFADEVRRFLDSELVRREFWKALTENTIELHAEIRFRPTAEGKPKPDVAATARTRPSRRRTRKK